MSLSLLVDNSKYVFLKVTEFVLLILVNLATGFVPIENKSDRRQSIRTK